MRQSTFAHAHRTSQVIVRWRGMGAILALAFYSLFFAAHQQFQDTPVYIRDGVLFGARTQTVFRDLTSGPQEDHRALGSAHPAFTLLHQPPTRLLAWTFQQLGQNPASASKHAVATLTGLAGALIVVMVYHALLWSGAASLRAILLAAACGAGPSLWLAASLPEVWIFAGLGVAALAAVTAKGELAPWWLHLLTAIYAMSCFVGNLLPVLIFALARCAKDSALHRHFAPRPVLVAFAAITLAFGLANGQRILFSLSAPLPITIGSWNIEGAPRLSADTANAGKAGREVFLSSIVAPRVIATAPDPAFGNRPRITLAEARWDRLDLQKGVGAAWLLLLALAFAGLVWRAQLDPFSLGIVAVIVWNIASLPWYGSPDRLLMLACLWTPAVVIATGLGLERSLEHWPKIRLPITLLIAAFFAAQVTRNWMFIQEVATQARL